MNQLIEARDAFCAMKPEQVRSVNGRDWGFIRNGETGPALVLLPGTLGRADIFWQQISAMSDEARILSLSYPSSGGISDWAGDITQMVSIEGMEGATILGSSLGGYVAQYVAATRPELFGGLIAANTLADASFVRAIPPYALDLEGMDIATLAEGFLRGLSQWTQPGHAYAELAELLIAEVDGRIPEAELRNRLIALKDAPPLPAQSLATDRISTVESDDDHLIPPPVREQLRAALQPGRAFRFGNASHFPYVTHPREYTNLIRMALGLELRGALGDVAVEDQV